ncbi:MAG: gluconokinase [Capsulimonadaceae bacterium]
MTVYHAIGLDIGTSSVRAILFDRRGRIVPGVDGPTVSQVPYDQHTTPDGGVETDADKLVGTVVSCLRQMLHRRGAARRFIAGVGTSCFWHSLVGVNAGGAAVTPVLSWADTRSSAAVPELRRRLSAAEYHRRTGCELHSSFWPAKILWLHNTGGDRNVARWMGFGEYLYLRLFGRGPTASISMASGTGLFNQSMADWDDQTLEALCIPRSMLPDLCDCDEPVQDVTTEFHGRIERLAAVPWFPAMGDGACSNIGSGAADSTRVGLNVGTSAALRVVAPAPAGTDLDIRPGLFCYRLNRDYALFGGAFSSGGNAHEWLMRTIRTSSETKSFGLRIARIAPDTHGLTVLPFWAGERSPGWHGDAHAMITGMNLHTTGDDIGRAAIEACVYGYDDVRERLLARFPEATEILISGGTLTHDSPWTQIIADVFGTTLTSSRVTEASSRGAAMIAFRGIGKLRDFDEAGVVHGRVYHANPVTRDAYCAGRARYQELYRRILGES